MGAWGRQRGRRKQWTGRSAAGDLWTRHSVIALDPFVFKRSREEEGWRWRGRWRWGAPGQKMVYNDSHFPALSSLATTACVVCQRWDGPGGRLDVGYDRNLDSSPLLFLFRGLA